MVKPRLAPSLAVVICAIVALLAPGIAAAELPLHLRGDHLVRVRIVPEFRAVATGRSTWLAVEFTPSPGWHIYWRNPGDSGAPPQIAWTLPRGASLGPTAWPSPKALTTGGVTTYVYDRPATLLIPLVLSNGMRARRDTAIAATLSWLVCSNVCVRGRGRASTSVTIDARAPAKAVQSKNDALFAAARARLPRAAQFETTFVAERGKLRLFAPKAAFAGEQVTGATFFPYDGQLIAQSAPERFAIDNRISLTLQRHPPQDGTPTRIDGVLAIDETDAEGHRDSASYAVSATRSNSAGKSKAGPARP